LTGANALHVGEMGSGVQFSKLTDETAVKIDEVVWPILKFEHPTPHKNDIPIH
jgi:hypothetical protein